MNTKFLDTLTDFGLGEKEAKVYVALLELEAGAVSEIAKKAKVNRSSTYVVLESLKKKGLVGISDTGKARRYVAASPDILLHTAKTSAEKQKKISANVEAILPQLKALHKDTKHKPVVKVFEGREDLIETYWTVFKEEGLHEFRVYEDPSGMLDVVPKDFIKYDSIERRKRNIKMYMIAPDTKDSREIVKQYRRWNSPDEFILIPRDKFMSSKTNVGITIYGDKVEISSIRGELFAIVIQNEELANVFKSIFDLAWEEAKKLGE